MGVATGMLVAAGISAAAGAYSAHKQSSASKDAARTQADAANQATQLQRDIYLQQRQDTMPWLQAGQGAVTTLSNLMGVPMNPIAGPPRGSTLGNPMVNPRQMPDSAIPTGRVAVPRPGSLADVAQTSGGFGNQQLVNMRAPDGSTQFVPQHQVDFYTSRGASVVN